MEREYPNEQLPDTGIDIVPVYDRADLAAVGCGTTHTVARLNKEFNYTTDAIYVLMDDINLSDANWTPNTYVITNAFLGNGHTISNMTITGEQTTKDVGLFSVCSARINKLIMDNVNISNLTYAGTATSVAGDYECTGVIAGCMLGDTVGYTTSGILTKCKTGGTIETAGGGLVGYIAEKDSTAKEGVLSIVSCTNEVVIQSGGGLINKVNTNLNIANCTNNSPTSAITTEIGGLIYQVDNGTVTISQCVNNSELVASKYAAGFIYNINNGNVNISECANVGNIAGSNKSAGFIYTTSSNNININIDKCVNNGKIGVTSQYVPNYKAAGFVCHTYSAGNLNITNSINNGEIIRRWRNCMLC